MNGFICLYICIHRTIFMFLKLYINGISYCRLTLWDLFFHSCWDVSMWTPVSLKYSFKIHWISSLNKCITVSPFSCWCTFRLFKIFHYKQCCMKYLAHFLVHLCVWGMYHELQLLANWMFLPSSLSGSPSWSAQCSYQIKSYRQCIGVHIFPYPL